MISDVADGMTDTETEKFQSLVEDVEFSDEESYKEKLKQSEKVILVPQLRY